ncbi:MAG: hypothetical protein ABIS50_09070 [Luteolibacter sp.]|uniref:hypothetical protein n=1 Tax=Luteolibacter sp. TaxID=1962973 RepID=UPI0032666E7D
MKTISLQLLLLCGSLLTVTQAQAGGPVSKTFGGFAAGKKFTLTVQEATSTKSVGTNVDNKVPVPEGIPKFKVGQKIAFTIGKKGELTGPNFSIALLNSTTNANSYAKQPTQKTVSPIIGSVFKDSSGKPVATTMTFYQYRITNYKLSVNLVGYVLK